MDPFHAEEKKMVDLESTPMFSLGKSGVKSTLRHMVFPLIAGGIMAALQTAQSGAFDMAAMKSAAITSIIAGIVRLLQVFVGPHQGVK